MTASSIRLGVDIGGTFTDVVLEKDGVPFSTKVLTTYAAPEDAIIEGLHNVCTKAGVDPSQINQIIHGTTLATNALIERRGAKTALITTEGFRDVIEMRTESRFEQYDLNLNLTLPEPLLPRQMRFTVAGRVDANGAVLVDIDRTEVETVVDEIAKGGFESVAVGLIHSYLNPAHEELVREVLAQKLPYVAVSISSEVSPQMREYERFNTVVANAYIKPLMASYLGRLEDRLKAEGVDGIFFGPADIAADIGKLGQPMDPQVWALIKPVAQKLIARGMPVGTLVLDPAFAAELLNEGFTFVACGTDASLLAKASDALLAQVKGGLS